MGKWRESLLLGMDISIFVAQTINISGNLPKRKDLGNLDDEDIE